MTVQEAQKQVALFMHGSNQVVRDLPEFEIGPMEILRCQKVLGEEIRETFEAMDNGDLVEIADGLGDAMYVILSIANTYGIHLDPILATICENNLAKIVEPKRFSPEGKLLKPPGHQPPDILALILDQVPGDVDSKTRFANRMLLHAASEMKRHV